MRVPRDAQSITASPHFQHAIVQSGSSEGGRRRGTTRRNFHPGRFRRASRFSVGRRRDGRTHAREELERYAAGPNRTLVAEFKDRREDPAHLALPDVDGVGTGADFFLQRRLSADSRREAQLGAGRIRPRSLAGNLARHRPAHRPCACDGRSDLGRGPVSRSGAQRLSRRDLSHVLLFAVGG